MLTSNSSLIATLTDPTAQNFQMLYEILKCDRRGRFVAYKSVWPIQNSAPPEPEHIESDLPFANVTDDDFQELYTRYDPLDYETSEVYDDDYLD